MQTHKLASTLILAAACALPACGGDDKPADDGSFTTGETGDGDGDSTTGDGDGDSTTGDGDGDSTTGDGDGDSTTGDGDGDSTTGDGDGDNTTGDGDGDNTTGGDGDGDATTGDGDGDTGGDIVPCDVPEIELATVVPHVMLVLDKSGSMIQNTWDHDNDPNTAAITRWKSLHAVVSTVVNNFDDQFEFGAQLYPSISATNEYNINACLVNSPPEVLVAPNNATNVLLGIPTANSQNIRGGTPTAAAMTSALNHLDAIADGDAAAIILVTDGAANCRTDAANQTDRFETYDPNLLGIVQNAWTVDEIPTYVVGIDISDAVTPITGVNNFPPNGEPDGISPFVQLNELAEAGGKPLAGDAKFYQTQNQIELDAAIQAIVDDAASCTVLLDPVPPFPNLVEIVMDGQSVPPVADCETEDGWVFTNPNGPYDSLQLCGTWCDQVPEAQIFKAEYYCDPG